MTEDAIVNNCFVAVPEWAIRDNMKDKCIGVCCTKCLKPNLFMPKTYDAVLKEAKEKGNRIDITCPTCTVLIYVAEDQANVSTDDISKTMLSTLDIMKSFARMALLDIES